MSVYLVIAQSGRRVRIPWRKWRLALSMYRAGVSLYVAGKPRFETLPFIYPVIR